MAHRLSDACWLTLRVAHWAVYAVLLLFFIAHLILTLLPATAAGWGVSVLLFVCPLHHHAALPPSGLHIPGPRI